MHEYAGPHDYFNESYVRESGLEEFRQVHAAGDLVMYAARR